MKNKNLIVPAFVISVVLLGVYTWHNMKKQQRGLLLSGLQSSFPMVALVSVALMMIKFDLSHQIVRVAYTVFDLAIIITILISITYLKKSQLRLKLN